jgi:hypothetical protein
MCVIVLKSTNKQLRNWDRLERRCIVVVALDKLRALATADDGATS